jgi:hypothetical protein
MKLNHRETNEHDKNHLQRWTFADPVHRDLISPDFWQPPLDDAGSKISGVKCVAVEDEKGVVFHLRFENVMRVYAQFPPEDEVDPERLRKALKESFVFIASGAKKIGYKEMIFDSVSQSLISFFKLFGFKELTDTYRTKL